MRRLGGFVASLALVFAACGGESGESPGLDTEDADTRDATVSFDTEVDSGAPDLDVNDASDGDADTATDTSACPGCFASPCEDNTDCDSGWCVSGPDGSWCSKTCSEACPSGWSCRPVSSGGADVSFICIYDHTTLCTPCDGPADCADPLVPNGQNRCVQSADDSGSFCATPCRADDECPDFARCDTLPSGDKVCRPIEGECGCSAYATQREASTSCAAKNPAGTCGGRRVCAEAGLSACDAAVPTLERCNRLDDDCDGETDEGDPESGAACDSDDADSCLDDLVHCEGGALVCRDEGGLRDEVCDGIDNDCDGLTDGADPSLVLVDCQNTSGVCAGFQRTADLCVDGQWSPCGIELYAALGVDLSKETLCDGLDDDCDGQTDEDFVLVQRDDSIVQGVGAACGAGACAGGTTQCAPNRLTLVCSSEGQVPREVCDGIDNDCDGLTDRDDADLARVACENQNGVCGGALKPTVDCRGSWGACGDSVYSTWSLAYQPGAELACDGQDNDCDGQTDEDFTVTMPDGGSARLGERCGVGLCAGGIARCGTDGANPLECSTAGNARVEVCNGLDDDCDGLTDGDDPDLVRPLCEEQRGVCGGAQKPASLCGAVSLGQWAACGAAAYQAHASAFAATETRCDGVDEDCDGKADDDFGIDLPDGSHPVGVGAACGVGGCAGGVLRCAASPAVGAPLVYCTSSESSAPEVCDGVDNDCDGKLDAADPDLVRAACGTQDGVCAGAEALPARCVGGQWGACIAADYSAHAVAYRAGAEASCDGVDEDCDGATDEDFALTLPDGRTVTGAGRGCGAGACSGGVTVCAAGGAGIVCDSGVASAPEVCDGEDNDCDGLTDAADPDLLRPLCDAQRGVCAGARKPADLCVQGAWQACPAATYTSHDARYDDAVERRCDGVDNDCDGSIDEDFVRAGRDGGLVSGVGQSCGVGACAGGVTACNAAGDGIVCPGEARATAEVCNGQDDDCDGLLDALDPGLALVPCEKTSGVCAGASKLAASCVAGQWTACVAADYQRKDPRYHEGSELACDGLDEDCDASTDEDFDYREPTGVTVRGAGKTCGLGACAGGRTTCNPARDGLVCDSAGAASPEACNALDDDCDGKTDALDPDLERVLCDKQDGVCAGSSKPVALCGAVTAGVWAPCTPDLYSSFDGRYQDGLERTCDGVDNDCDAKVDDDFTFTQLNGVTVSGVGTSCGVGRCGGGALVCNASANGVRCPSESQATSERCDGTDEDCDGFTDAEDTSLQPVNCELQAGECAGAQKPSSLCVQGAWQSCGAAVYEARSAAYQAGLELSCDARDNDCDGSTDEDFDLVMRDGTPVQGTGKACGRGACAGGVTTCNVGQNGILCPSEANVSSELCNGQDDDCDGKTDALDADLVRVACDNQKGVCNGSLRPVSRCTAGAWAACLAADYLAFSADFDAGSERRCDAKDNDCDGASDEDFAYTDPGGLSATIGQSCGRGACAGGSVVCAASGTAVTCSTAERAGGEICDGLDQSCNGVTDEGCDKDGDGYCDVALAVLGRPAVCPQGGGDCNDALATVHPGAVEVCNGVDEDCDLTTDEDYTGCLLARCAASGQGYAATAADACVSGQCATPAPTSCGLYACSAGATGDRCATSCANDQLCVASAHCDERDQTCKPDVADGQLCLEGSDCVSGHCQNGRCCSGGDCCAAPADCPAAYAVAPSCDAAQSCTGTRKDKVCQGNVCGTSAPIPDDRACSAQTLALDCGPAYPPLYCNGTATQDPPSCPTSCPSDAACAAAHHCDGQCVPDVGNGGACDEASDCVSRHCQNGYCCASGDCCAQASNCPASYTSAATCDAAPTCSGTRVDAQCVGAVCKRSDPIDDDRACTSGVVANTCGLYTSVSCAGTATQTPPTCPTSCQSDAGCDAEAHCDAVCVLDVPDGGACDEASDCTSGHCQNGFCCSGGDCCATAGNCPASYSSAPVCTTAATCQGAKSVASCVASVCGTVSGVGDDSACGAGTVANTCGPYPSVSCNGAANQNAPGCATSCVSDANCDANAYCKAGACVLDEADGGACTSDAQCVSAHCSQGTCCSGGDCCRTASDCSPATWGVASTCRDQASCQGKRKDPVCQANVCKVGPELDDDSGCGGLEANLCGLYPSTLCTFAVAQSAPVCAATCNTQSDCDAGAFCDADHTCKPVQGAGATCQTSVQCGAGLTCVDGVCCTSSCGGACRRCDLSGNGTCTFVGSGLDPDNECAGVSCTGYHFGFVSDVCRYKQDVSDAEATCNGAGACASRAELCTAQSQVGPASPVTCDTLCQDPVVGTCTGTTAGSCANVDQGTVSCGAGACQRTVSRCVGGFPNACVAGQPSNEVCNASDDDCDSQTDASDPDLLTWDLKSCEVQVGVCAGAKKPAALCAAGQWGACTAATYAAYSSQYQSGGETKCDGLDNDCDGSSDEDFSMVGLDGRLFTGVGKSCGVGLCAGGTTTCKGDQLGIRCDKESLAVAETCNGNDDDCDGLLDQADGSITRANCELQQGVCSGAVKPLALCNGASGWGACTTATYTAFTARYQAATETSCDAFDNDCDGSTDEDFSYTPPSGATVSGLNKACGLGRCAGGVTQCNATQNGLVCSTAGAAQAEVCNGIDDDCDGLTDGADPDLAIPNCENQSGVCAGAKKPVSLCQGASGWAACSAATYALAAQPGGADYQSGAETRCDGKDNDCDASTDEDFSLTLLNGQVVSGVNTACGVGACANGRTQCVNGNAITCPSQANATAERCDGVDNDCDGALDGGDASLTLDNCDKTLGVCAGSKHIASECVSGSWQNCATSRYGANYDGLSETRCDGLDGDCSGQTDEDFTYFGPDGTNVTGGINKSCGTGRCAGGTTVCNALGIGVTCSTAGNAQSEVCGRVDTNFASLDDDCDGLTDGSDIAVFPSCAKQGGECAGSKQVDWQSCVSGAWAACDATDYSATAGKIWQATETLCDVRDNDCNGTTDGADTTGDGPLHTNQNGVCAGTRQVCTSGSWVDSYPATLGTFELPNDPPGTGTLDENCDGIDGTVSSAWFVSPSGSGVTCTQAAPCTLTTAISNLTTQKPHIYLMAGTYTGPWNVTKVGELYGGYSTSWVRGDRSSDTYAAKLQGGLFGSEYMTVRVVGTSGAYLGTAGSPVKLVELQVLGPILSALSNGKSSYAVYASYARLNLVRVIVTQGVGAAGSSGSAGVGFSVQTPPGGGGDGQSAENFNSVCNDGRRGGGGGGANTSCSSANGGGGGQGGQMDTDCSCCWPDLDATSGTGGGNAAIVSGSNGLGGGGGGTCGGGVGVGQPGRVSHGSGGVAPGNGYGKLNNGFWQPLPGTGGGLGLVGGGGGGGGGSGGCDTDQDSRGAGGGGGGAGGCAAPTAGGAGTGGGASFGVFGYEAFLTLDRTNVTRASGGAGGGGGVGGSGQPGASGGSGGAAATRVAAGGRGGNGGTGGHSGGGAGGAGGASFSVFWYASTLNTTGSATVSGGSLGGTGATGGGGGSGGSISGGNGGASGPTGASGETHRCVGAGGCGP